jgi:hypothetical protein
MVGGVLLLGILTYGDANEEPIKRWSRRFKAWADDWSMKAYGGPSNSVRPTQISMLRFCFESILNPKLGFVSVGLVIALMLNRWLVLIATLIWFGFRLPVVVASIFGSNQVAFLVARWPSRTGIDGRIELRPSIVLTSVRNAMPVLVFFFAAKKLSTAATLLRNQGSREVVSDRVTFVIANEPLWHAVAYGIVFTGLIALGRLLVSWSQAPGGSQARLAVNAASKLILAVVLVMFGGLVGLVMYSSEFSWNAVSSASAGLGFSILFVAPVLAAREQILDSVRRIPRHEERSALGELPPVIEPSVRHEGPLQLWPPPNPRQCQASP